MTAALVLLIFPALAIIAALKDATSYTIPNWICLALLAGYFPAALVAGLPAAVFGLSLLAGLAVLVAGMGLFAAGWIGGGDAKFMAAVSLWLGVAATPAFLLTTALCGGALALILMALRSPWLAPVTARGPTWARRLASPGASAPYGVAISIAALVAFPLSVPAAALMGLVAG